MSIEKLKDQWGDFARDTKVNIGNVLSDEGSPGLTSKQIKLAALACAYNIGSGSLIEAALSDFRDHLSDEEINAAKSAAVIMGMNNVYYRFLHLSEDQELSKLPARLRMQVIGKPIVDKTSFELMCLAVSALNGCGNCIQSHIAEVKKGGITLEGVQSCAKIAAVMQSAAVAIKIS